MTITTYIPAATPAVTWSTLVEANPSLRSWERSAASAGSNGYGWWLRWAESSRYLRVDVSAAVFGDGDAFHAAMATARRHLAEVFQAARDCNRVTSNGRKAGFPRESGPLASDLRSSGERFARPAGGRK
jgi:hypothetical protein